MQMYAAEVLFEVSLDVGGQNYLTIFGKHVNGYFCAIPNCRISCEMAEASDKFYNAERLIGAGLNVKVAQELAEKIYQIMQVMNRG